MESQTTQSCVTPPRRKRTWVPGSITNVYSAKRRRVSMTAAELARDISQDDVENQAPVRAIAADRFIAPRATAIMPLNTTPRSQRIGRLFGLVGDRILEHADSSVPSTPKELGVQRFCYSSLLSTPSKTSVTSAATHLGTRKQFILALDGPGIPSDPFAYPLSWSSRNTVAVACGRDVYYQDLDTRAISHLCKLTQRRHGRLTTIEWSIEKPHVLALGTTSGYVQLRDAEAKVPIREWDNGTVDWCHVGGMSWNGNALAMGGENGDIVTYDIRAENEISRLTMHKSMVLGLRWSQDGKYLVSGDQRGVVQLWDARAGKALTNDKKLGSKMKHSGPVKALAWCPWKPDLFATGSTYPDGKIRIYNVNALSPGGEPLHTLSLHTSVTSLIWSPHCKELLSTQGTSWVPRPASTPSLPRSSRRAAREDARPVPVKGPLTNSLTVHAYPSLRRVVSVQAHSGAVGHSCLSPDGTLVFTICPAEEAMKMWKVWGVSGNVERRESAFDKCGIR